MVKDRLKRGIIGEMASALKEQLFLVSKDSFRSFVNAVPEMVHVQKRKRIMHEKSENMQNMKQW